MAYEVLGCGRASMVGGKSSKRDAYLVSTHADCSSSRENSRQATGTAFEGRLEDPYLQLKRMLCAEEQVEVHGLGVVQLPHLLGNATL